MSTPSTGRSRNRIVSRAEAGHAVAAWHLRIPIGLKSVTIVSTEEDDFLGFCALGKPGYRYSRTRNFQAHNRWITERSAVVELAGHAAEKRSWRRWPRDYVHSRDYRRVRDTIRWALHCDDDEERSAYLQLLEVRAKRLVDKYWMCVEAVAAALIERSRLSKGEALFTINEAYDRRPRKWQVAPTQDR